MTMFYRVITYTPLNEVWDLQDFSDKQAADDYFLRLAMKYWGEKFWGEYNRWDGHISLVPCP